MKAKYEWHIITNTEWVDAEAASTRLAAEMKMDQDAFIVSVFDAQASNPFDALYDFFDLRGHAAVEL